VNPDDLSVKMAMDQLGDSCLDNLHADGVAGDLSKIRDESSVVERAAL
jgi:hypothetical protein